MNHLLTILCVLLLAFQAQSADKARPAPLENIFVDAGAVDVVHEGLAAIFGRPIISLVDEQTRVCMSAASRG